jgi:transcriptional regulator with XRE-family HTH domain
MPSIRSLRLSRGMTLIELALEAGIPARTLGAIEYGHAPLDADSAARLAARLGVAPELLFAGHRPTTNPLRRVGTGWPPRNVWTFHHAAALLAAALISELLLTQAPLWQPALVASTPAFTSTSAVKRRSAPTPPPAPRRGALVAPPTSAPPIPTTAPPTIAPSTPMPTPTPAFRLEADGPHGCPLITTGWILITQGYGEGTHAPAATMGALDLAVDGDGDGAADPAATAGLLVVATHAGVARVFPMSWPGGNFVLVEDAQSGWSTAYAHLDGIAVADGQFVEAGVPLGTVGSTGEASGPHLHYEVRYGGVNLDPSGLITCW